MHLHEYLGFKDVHGSFEALQLHGESFQFLLTNAREAIHEPHCVRDKMVQKSQRSLLVDGTHLKDDNVILDARSHSNDNCNHIGCIILSPMQ